MLGNCVLFGHIIVLMGKFCDLALTVASFLPREAKAQERLTVNFGIFEHSRWNVIIKQQVNLAECAVLGLGKAEPAPDVAKKVGAGVKETSFGSPIPG
jgi:hypothetical protein